MRGIGFKELCFIAIIIGIFVIITVSELPKSDAERKIMEIEKQEKIKEYESFYACTEKFTSRMCVRFNNDINAIYTYYKLPLDTLNP